MPLWLVLEVKLVLSGAIGKSFNNALYIFPTQQVFLNKTLLFIPQASEEFRTIWLCQIILCKAACSQCVKLTFHWSKRQNYSEASIQTLFPTKLKVIDHVFHLYLSCLLFGTFRNHADVAKQWNRTLWEVKGVLGIPSVHPDHHH